MKELEENRSASARPKCRQGLYEKDANGTGNNPKNLQVGFLIVKSFCMPKEIYQRNLLTPESRDSKQ